MSSMRTTPCSRAAALEVEVGHREMDGDGARRDLERPIAGVQRRVGNTASKYAAEAAR